MNNDRLQLSLSLATKEQLHTAWAFASDVRGHAKRRRAKTTDNLRYCVITSCSRQAKSLGIRVGMRYLDAVALVPEMKILVIGYSNREVRRG
jgi:uncharacterized protein YunC (DUF1805 family)